MLPTFLIGVWQAPASDFAKWQSRGCNCAICIPQNNDTNAWIAAANSAGLGQIRQPVGNLASDAKNATLLAWMHSDEPDANHVSATVIAQNYRNYKAAAPNLPVLITLSGGYVLGLQKGITQSAYAPYLAAADWIGSDFYPITGWNRPDLMGDIGSLLDTLSTWSAGKPQIAFIECSNQGLPWVPNDRGPTAAEVRGEVWEAIIHGAGGICYFPQSHPAGGGAFAYDGTPSDVASEITAINTAIGSLAFLTAAWPSTPITLPSPFQGRQWQQGTDQYSLVLNLSATTATLPSVISGGTGVTLAAYECGLWHNGQFVSKLASTANSTATTSTSAATPPATNTSSSTTNAVSIPSTSTDPLAGAILTLSGGRSYRLLANQ